MSLNKKRIAILGGTFDPPTLGHLKIGEYLLHTLRFNEVWIIPAYKHTFDKTMSDFDHRMNMCKLMFIDNKFIVSEFHKEKDCDGSTLNLLNLLQEEYDHTFYIVIGSDNANVMHKWISYEQLIKTAKFIVLERKNQELNSKITWCLHSPHIYVKHFDTGEVSSSMIRDAVRDNVHIDNFTCEHVIKYIEENNLYK